VVGIYQILLVRCARTCFQVRYQFHYVYIICFVEQVHLFDFLLGCNHLYCETKPAYGAVIFRTIEPFVKLESLTNKQLHKNPSFGPILRQINSTSSQYFLIPSGSVLLFVSNILYDFTVTHAHNTNKNYIDL